MSALPIRLQYALSAAGAVFAKHVRAGDHLDHESMSPALADEVNYTLRARGLRLVQAHGIWTCVRVNPITLDEFVATRGAS